MKIVSIPCRSDNYAYLLICEATNKAVVVDPSSADPVVAELGRHDIELVAVWNTHHHFDHVEGNDAVLNIFPNAVVVAHHSDKGRVPKQTVFAEEGQVLRVGEEIVANVIFNPGHTTGAISYHLLGQKMVFTGDTLFAAGCGRVFEGTSEQMYESLTKLVALPPETKVYSGHEYTESNLRFALAAEPSNKDTAKRLELVQALRESGESTMGSLMSEELATNVFVRVHEPEILAALSREEPPTSEDPSDVFAALRRWKDRF